MRRRLLSSAVRLFLFTSIAILASPLPGALAKKRSSLSPLRASGQFLVDSDGYVVIPHGVNAVYKLPPYHLTYKADPPYDPDSNELTGEDIDNMAALGFNSVRLGVIWKGLEPCKVNYLTCNFDRDYLREIKSVVRQLEARGIYVLLDFHQDLWSDTQQVRCLTFFRCDFHGEGAPDWATNNDNKWIGPPLGDLWGVEYFIYPGISAAFDHLFNPSNNWNQIQEHYQRSWKTVARWFRRDPGVLGYDLFNEPWPGTILPNETQDYDREALLPFFQGLIDAIRTVDRRHTIYYEPDVMNDFAPLWSMPSEYDPQDPQGNLGLSYHVYCLLGGADICNPLEAQTMGLKKQELRERGIVGFLSEFGASSDYDQTGYVADLADTHSQGWNYWQWKFWDDPTGSAEEYVAHPDGTLDQDKAEQLARTYPQRIAADDPGRTGREPQWCFTRHIFDPPSSQPSPCENQTEGHFKLTYNADRPSRVTTIYVPVNAPLDDDYKVYPNGYRVTSISGARVISPPNAPLLRIKNRTWGEVRVELEPR